MTRADRMKNLEAIDEMMAPMRKHAIDIAHIEVGRLRKRRRDDAERIQKLLERIEYMSDGPGEPE